MLKNDGSLCKLKLSSNKYLKIHPHIMILIGSGVYCAGGAARSFVSGEPIRDYDLFFKNADELRYVRNFFKSRNALLKFECPEGKMFSYVYQGIKVQLVCSSFYKDINELLSSFDFTVTQFAFDDQYFYTYYKSLYDCKHKRLRLNKLSFPSASIKRIHKYITYGYIPDANFYTEIVERIHENSDEIIDPQLVYID